MVDGASHVVREKLRRMHDPNLRRNWIKTRFARRNLDTKIVVECPVGPLLTDARGRTSGFVNGHWCCAAPERDRRGSWWRTTPTWGGQSPVVDAFRVPVMGGQKAALEGLSAGASLRVGSVNVPPVKPSVRSSDYRVTIPGAAAIPTSTATQQAASSSHRYQLTGPASGFLLARSNPRTGLRMELGVNCSQPGQILDTVGINAAPIGSFALYIRTDGHLQLSVYDPGRQSSGRASNGWHLLASGRPATRRAA